MLSIDGLYCKGLSLGRVKGVYVTANMDNQLVEILAS